MICEFSPSRGVKETNRQHERNALVRTERQNLKKRSQVLCFPGLSVDWDRHMISARRQCERHMKRMKKKWKAYKKTSYERLSSNELCLNESKLGSRIYFHLRSIPYCFNDAHFVNLSTLPLPPALVNSNGTAYCLKGTYRL